MALSTVTTSPGTSLFALPSSTSLFALPSSTSLFAPPSSTSLFAPPSSTSLFISPSSTSLFNQPSSISTSSIVKPSSTIPSATFSSISTSTSITIAPVSTNNSTINDAGGISNGAAAGIGVGCALAGALIAALIVLFFFRKRQRPVYPQQHLPPDQRAYSDTEKHGITATSAPIQSGAVTNIDRLLPQPAEDAAIIGAFSKIRDGIKNHAQNYYHSNPVRHDVVDEARLVELATATAIPTATIYQWLLNPATRVRTIRLFLAHLILSRCSGRSDGQLSFLPSEISNPAAFRSGEVKTAGQAALFSKWKTISGVLLQQQYGQVPDEQDRRSSSIAQALAATEPVLNPFIDPSVDTQVRRRNLEGIMRRAAQFAFLLFSQPASFQFDYTSPSTGPADTLLVFPALLQTTNDAAEGLEPPRVLSAKESI